MNKKELIEGIANTAKINKVTAEKALGSILEKITESLNKGDGITLVGFGSFSVSKRQERQGRNPKTGEAIKIPAKKVVRFKAGKDLSESLAA